ncbi:MAG TPA: hypothetical protein VFW33_11495 [Gemmataceae bacterium]|nr:hypothetical protein [Gemmataceae bacterium]
MSLAQSNRDARRPRILIQLGVGVLAASCVVVILLSALAKVQDNADRLH